MYELLIKNGRIVDVASGIDQIWDVAIQKGEIAGIGTFLAQDAQTVIDASGCMVTAGLIDHHAHLYPMSQIGIPAEAVCFASGVTTAVDAGSTGCQTYGEYQGFLKSTKLSIRSYLNVCPTGLACLPQKMEQVDPAFYDIGAMREVFAQYGDDLLGLKLRTSKEIVGELGCTPLKKTVAAAESLGVPVMVHCTNPPASMAHLVSCLRPGDIMTHMYMNKGSTILDEKGEICKEVLMARKRGVLFEAADARAHFSFEVSKPAIKQGFAPDIIATDLTKYSMYLRPTAFSLASQMAKYSSIGMPFEQVLASCTVTPARYMGLSKVAGCLKTGIAADIAVFKKVDTQMEFGDRPYSDSACAIQQGKIQWEPVLTVKKGEVVFRSLTF